MHGAPQDSFSLENNLRANGFLGEKENLTEVVKSDSGILAKYKTSHTLIAKSLEKLFKERFDVMKDPLNYLNPKYEVVVDVLGGYTNCPFGCRPYCLEDNLMFKGGLTILKNGSSREQIIEAMLVGMYGRGLHHLKIEKIDDPSISFLIGGCELPNSKSIEDSRNFLLNLKEKSMNGKDLPYSSINGILPHLVKQHRFFGGNGSFYRVEPEFLLNALKSGYQQL